VVVLARAGDAEGVLRELALRIKGVLGDLCVPLLPLNLDVVRRNLIAVGEIVIDQGAHRVTVSGDEVSLTRLEFKLLVALAERRDRVCSRRGLLGEVWSTHVRQRTVDIHVTRLRKKLKSAGRFIQTVRGAGYRFGGRSRRDPPRIFAG
jgi:two-component system phosphate regulon response regulator PhoB